MKPYLISNDVLGRQVFRYHPAYRFAGFVLCLFLGAQIPLVAWLVSERSTTAQRQERAEQLAADSAHLASERKVLAPTENKLKRIQVLTPLLRSRLPVGAVLGKIEQLIPPDLTLARITIDAETYQLIQLEGSGIFHVPRQMRISIQGEQSAQARDPETYSVFAQELLRSLPPESKIAESTLDPGVDTVASTKTFHLTLSAPTNANYYGLGVTKLAAENSL